MYKVSITFLREDGYNNFDIASPQYLTAIVPMVGDEINILNSYYKVIKRTFFVDNLNFFILHVKPTTN